MKSKLSEFYVSAPLACLCCVLWGSAFPCIKIGYSFFGIESGDYSSQILFAGIRFTLAGMLTIAFGSIMQKEFLVPKKTSWKYAVVLSLVQTSVHYMFFYIGVANSTGSKASILDSSSTFMVIILCGFFFKDDRLNIQKLLGCIVGFAGIVLVNFNGFDFSFSLFGEGFILISSLLYGLSSILIKVFTRRENPVTLSGWQFLMGGVFMTAAGVVMGGKITNVNVKGVLLIVYLGLVSAVAYTLWGVLLKYNKVSGISVFSFVIPICGVTLSTLILREKINPALCVSALVLVSAGIFLVNYRFKPGGYKKTDLR